MTLLSVNWCWYYQSIDADIISQLMLILSVNWCCYYQSIDAAILVNYWCCYYQSIDAAIISHLMLLLSVNWWCYYQSIEVIWCCYYQSIDDAIISQSIMLLSVNRCCYYQSINAAIISQSILLLCESIDVLKLMSLCGWNKNSMNILLQRFFFEFSATDASIFYSGTFPKLYTAHVYFQFVATKMLKVSVAAWSLVGIVDYDNKFLAAHNMRRRYWKGKNILLRKVGQ